MANKAKKIPHPHTKLRDKIPVDIESVLRSTFRKYNLESKISEYSFVSKWEEIVGATIAKRTKPECIKGKIFFVRVENSVWAQELSFHKEQILEKLKLYMPTNKKIDDIVFFVKGEMHTSSRRIRLSPA